MQNCESDIIWLLARQPLATGAEQERFADKVAHLVSDLQANEDEARQQALEEYFPTD